MKTCGLELDGDMKAIALMGPGRLFDMVSFALFRHPGGSRDDVMKRFSDGIPKGKGGANHQARSDACHLRIQTKITRLGCCPKTACS